MNCCQTLFDTWYSCERKLVCTWQPSLCCKEKLELGHLSRVSQAASDLVTEEHAVAIAMKVRFRGKILGRAVATLKVLGVWIWKCSEHKHGTLVLQWEEKTILIYNSQLDFWADLPFELLFMMLVASSFLFMLLEFLCECMKQCWFHITNNILVKIL